MAYHNIITSYDTVFSFQHANCYISKLKDDEIGFNGTLRGEEIRSSVQTTRRHIPEKGNIQS